MAEAICCRTARALRLAFAMPTIFSKRDKASRGEFAWIVAKEPSWPVFIACSMSSASLPRTSPKIIRSGRIRREFFNRARWGISPLPSILEGRVSNRTTCGCCNCNSAASSMVTMRSSAGMKPEITFSKVVLPLPVPPEIKILIFAFANAPNNVATGRVKLLNPSRSGIDKGFTEKRRIDRIGPSIANGGIMALTREPSGKRASTMGLDSSIRRPIRETIFSITFNR